MAGAGNHWNAHARQWSRIGRPLRPAPEDLAFITEALREWQKTGGRVPARLLLLGVTPEIATLPRPAGAQLVAVDHSLAMIRAVWPGATRGDLALCGTWQRLPIRDGSVDVVLGDGCFTSFERRADYVAAVRGVRRALRADGLFVMRFFVRPEAREAPDRVMDDLLHARIGSFHAFKWRLAMALHGGLDDGVRLAEVWRVWHEAVPDPAALAARLAWPVAEVRTIDAYRDAGARYTFPTLAELRAILEPAFDELACRVPDYELGARCPTLVLRPRDGQEASR